MGQGKGSLDLSCDGAHYKVVIAEDLCAHAIGFHLNALMQVQPSDEVLDGRKVAFGERIVTYIDGGIHIVLNLPARKINNIWAGITLWSGPGTFNKKKES